ncbi:MAG TPA: hypothetical protein VGN14_18790 [Candidatus Elarobacter sp.]
MSEHDPDRVPHPPYEELRQAAADDPAAAQRVDALHQAMTADKPDPAAIREHASALRSIPALEARIANWWDSPDTQRWVLFLTDFGL